MDRILYYTTLDEAEEACVQIQRVLTDQLEKQSNYTDAIQKDFVVLENLKSIIFVVKNDIEKGNFGGCMELILRIAANEFKDKLEMIPEEKILRNKIIKNLDDIHRQIRLNEI